MSRSPGHYSPRSATVVDSTTVNLVKPLTANEPPLVAVTIENMGASGPRRYSTCARFRAIGFRRGASDDGGEESEESRYPRSRTTTGSLFGGGTKTLGEEHVAAIAADKSRLYISGFGEISRCLRCWHQTTFCFWISGNVTLEPDDGPCDIGNTATRCLSLMRSQNTAAASAIVPRPRAAISAMN